MVVANKKPLSFIQIITRFEEKMQETNKETCLKNKKKRAFFYFLSL